MPGPRPQAPRRARTARRVEQLLRPPERAPHCPQDCAESPALRLRRGERERHIIIIIITPHYYYELATTASPRLSAGAPQFFLGAQENATKRRVFKAAVRAPRERLRAVLWGALGRTEELLHAACGARTPLRVRTRPAGAAAAAPRLDLERPHGDAPPQIRVLHTKKRFATHTCAVRAPPAHAANSPRRSWGTSGSPSAGAMVRAAVVHCCCNSSGQLLLLLRRAPRALFLPPALACQGAPEAPSAPENTTKRCGFETAHQGLLLLTRACPQRGGTPQLRTRALPGGQGAPSARASAPTAPENATNAVILRPCLMITDQYGFIADSCRAQRVLVYPVSLGFE